ncbi:phage capsid protein [Paraclostridium bifermentans]|uniref:phage major capsid protein n=1 Tax=Paraclostridium bifermentans TaxID=1490 RepID=UPI0025B09C9E|nr:phage capsid protein [Paraclostridium bifermentans]
MGFKRTLWEATILNHYHNASVADVICVKPVSKQGEKVIFSVAGEGAVKDYTGTVVYDDATTTDVELIFDKKKYFAIKMDDVEAAQTNLPVMQAHTEEHAYALVEQVDKDVLAKAIAEAGKTITGGAIDKTNIYDLIVDMGTALSKNKVPKANRFVVVNSEILGLLSKDDRFTRNPVVLANGVVEGQKINGLQVVSSEELPAGKIFAMHKSALGYDKILDKVEHLRLESSFGEAVRGLGVYGAKVLRPKGIVGMTYTIGA